MLVSRMEELGSDEDSSHITLRKIASRVMAMAHVYDQLLVSGQEKGISIAAYLSALIGEITQIYGSIRPQISLEHTIDDIDTHLDHASVLGLIVTELLTNAYMHAFPKGIGNIQISLVRIPDQKSARLVVADDGIGFKKAHEIKRNGIKLIRMLVEQLDGTIEISNQIGAHFMVEFPV